MFYRKELKRTILLHPKYFDKNLKNTVKERLVREIRGENLGPEGYCIEVLDVGSITRGKLQPSTGFGVFHITFNAILLRPYLSEVLQAQVTLVNKLGFYASVGPLELFVSHHCMEGFEDGYNDDLQQWESKDEDEVSVIKQNSDVTVRVIGSRILNGEWKVVATIDGDYLGEEAIEG
jgi:DNA-directed RNA polymerase II subunit RPB7